MSIKQTGEGNKGAADPKPRAQCQMDLFLHRYFVDVGNQPIN